MGDRRAAPPPTLADLIRTAQPRLAAAGSASPRLDAEVLLRHVMGLDRVQLFTRLADPAPAAVAATYDDLIARRVAGTPVAYLTGRREFMGMDFLVDPRVLIPRPETELLVEWALAWLTPRDRAAIVDVGTGSGAIAVSIAALATADTHTIVASDVSAEALSVARANADRLLTPPRRVRVLFEQGSLLGWRRAPLDLLLANLPYLTDEQIAENPDLAAEPHTALAGGGAGLALIHALVADAPRILAPQGAIGLEIDPAQAGRVTNLLRATFPRAEVDIIRDLAGHDRHVVMTLP